MFISFGCVFCRFTFLLKPWQKEQLKWECQVLWPTLLPHRQFWLVLTTIIVLCFQCESRLTNPSSLMQGAGRLLRDSGKHPAQLRSEVCTPGGTTIYGLHTLEQGGVRASTMSAVESATERAKELGRKPASRK